MAPKKSNKPSFAQLMAQARKRDANDRAFSAHLDADAYRRMEKAFLDRGDEVVGSLLGALEHGDPAWRRVAVKLLAALAVTPTVGRALVKATHHPDAWVGSIASNRLMDHFGRPVAEIIAEIEGSS